MTLPSCQKPRQCQAEQLQIIQPCSGHGMWETRGSCWRQLCPAPPGPPSLPFFWGAARTSSFPPSTGSDSLPSLLSASCTLSTLSFINSPGWDRWGEGAAAAVPSRLLLHHTASNFNPYTAGLSNFWEGHHKKPCLKVAESRQSLMRRVNNH